jgi:hypothetical protein
VSAAQTERDLLAVANSQSSLKGRRMKWPLDAFRSPAHVYRHAYNIYRKAVIALCIVVSLVCAGLGLQTALKAGPIWDDPTTVAMMGVLVQIGIHPEQSYEAGKSWIEGVGERGAGFYGAVTQFLAHWLETVATGESWLTVTYSVSAIMWRHVVCFIFTLCSILALFHTVSRISRSRAFGVMTIAVLSSTPVFLGISVIDEKDAPIAAGMTFLSCGTALLLWRLFQNDHISSRPKLLERPAATDAVAAVMIFLGTIIAFGTRVGAAALIGLECAIVGFLFLLALPRGIARVALASAILLFSVCAGVVLAIAVNPLARKAPIQWMMEGILYAVHPATQPLKLYGQTINSGALPWWYVPGWILAEYSATFLALVVLGGVAVTLLWRRGARIEAAYPWVPFIVQGFVLPICIVASGAVLHDRLRHLVFIIPALSLLAALGLSFCVDAIGIIGRRAALVLAILGPAFLLVNFTNTLMWYPYQYAYLSEIARAFPQYAFDNEPLGLSITEAVARMRQQGISRFYAGPAPISPAYQAEKSDVTVELLHPNTPHALPVPGGGAYYVHTRPSWGYAGLPAFCRTLFKIERQGFILGVGGTC